MELDYKASGDIAEAHRRVYSDANGNPLSEERAEIVRQSCDLFSIAFCAYCEDGAYPTERELTEVITSCGVYAEMYFSKFKYLLELVKCTEAELIEKLDKFSAYSKRCGWIHLPEFVERKTGMRVIKTAHGMHTDMRRYYDWVMEYRREVARSIKEEHKSEGGKR